MKKIIYLGKEYEVEDDVNYVATDADGSVSGYKGVPNRTPAYWSAMEYYYWIGFDKNIDANWKDSLREVKDIIVKEDELKVGDKVELLRDRCGFKKGQIVELYKLSVDGVHLFKGANARFRNGDDEQSAYLAPSNYVVIGKIKPHPHADLMLKYAVIAQYDDNPWESFECDLGCQSWCAMADTSFHSGFNYRLKPQEPKIQIGQIWVSREGVKVTIRDLANKLVFTNIEIGGIVIPWSFKEGVFFGGFKRKE